MSKAKNYIVGIFDDHDKLLNGVEATKNEGYKISDVISPYPIHEVIESLNLKTRIPVLALLYGIFAVLVTFGFLYWTSVVDYPLRFGGKPQNTLSFVVVIFVMTINITSAFTIVTFFLREKKGPGAKAHVIDEGLGDDKYAIILDEEEEKTAQQEEYLKQIGAIRIVHDKQK
ncbi:MAG: DUF3341 domain-containing protein [Bacteroidales bacterium]|nr:DUF3341 domain-containing protein [Bacteroidales bacterium]MCF8386818.1 DUF3341 domain-containing protein [Bacteroidales bacterium]MCF8398653.1 DUF3341 domain-containing protein [Bacteroidales bacterium]